MRVNWAVLGIGAGALVTVGVIVAIVASPGARVEGTTLLTVDQLATASPSASASAMTSTPAGTLSGTVAVHDDGCIDLVVDGESAWAVWPTGTSQDGDVVVLPDGRRLGDGDGVTGTIALIAKADVAALAGDSGAAALAEFCVGDDGPLALVSSLE
ncbi:MAG: hypothetical protein QM635_05055 [Microbacteriaceae bacterium]